MTLRYSRARGLNVLILINATRNRNVNPLDLPAAGGKAHFKFEAIVIVGILIGTIERDESRKFGAKHCLTLVALSAERCTVTVPWLGATASRIAGNGPAVQSARMLV
jgi:hypothetical protein